jgi:hypothetical protein
VLVLVAVFAAGHLRLAAVGGCAAGSEGLLGLIGGPMHASVEHIAANSIAI